MDPPSGPLGAATQSTGKTSSDNPQPPRPPQMNTVRRIPNPAARNGTSGQAVTAQGPISSSQVVVLAREALKHAIEENQTKAAEASGVSNELKPRVTIDLSHKNIKEFPEEVVDIIKGEIERLALSHNRIETFPSRFAECTSLRYLNVRSNVIREFPAAICQLTFLEILDVGRNKLRTLPPELAKLTSLKVLSVQKNRIEDLPLFLADMTTLQVLKLHGNPIRFPPKEVLQPQPTSPPNGGFLDKSEVHDVTVTTQIKKFLKQRAIMDRSDMESAGEESSEGAETPRPMKRVMSGRFPIKVNGTEVPDLRSPALPRPPPIPSRSHYRGLSQQNAALRRPGVMPLTIGNSNERLRSNSESLLQASRERSDRSRRMGVALKSKEPNLVTVDEAKSNRYSHYRGLSHGSAMLGGSTTVNGGITSRSPASPAESTQRATYVRRLSSLPERKRESQSPDPIIEGAKGILYALFQVHPHIQSLIGLARDTTNKRTSLERVFYNATTHVEELDRDLQSYITYSEEDEEVSPRSNENVQNACLTCVSAYIHVCALLERNVETILNNGDPRYIRTLLLLVYGSLAEVRNAGVNLFGNEISKIVVTEAPSNGTLRPHTRDKSVTPTRDRPNPGSRSRNGSRNGTAMQSSDGLRVGGEVQQPAFLATSSRSGTMTSTLSASTPRSGESFGSTSTSAGPLRNIPVTGEFTEEDRQFEKIFLNLQDSAELALKQLPNIDNSFMKVMQINSQRGYSNRLRLQLQILIQKCQMAMQTAGALKARLSLIKLKEPGVRRETAFWDLCKTFLNAYYDLVMKVKEVRDETKSMAGFFPMDVIGLLKTLHNPMRQTGHSIRASPWATLASMNSNQLPNSGGVPMSASNSSSGVNMGGNTMLQNPAPIPMTPASAALGPAVQATVPSTPQSGSYNSMFAGTVFERADALLSSGASSRTGTMNSSISGLDGTVTPNSSFTSIMSPLGGSGTARYNLNGRV